MTSHWPSSDPAYGPYRAARRTHWDCIARQDAEREPGAAAYYHRRLAEIYGFLVPPGERVLELGCGLGDLLASVRPRQGVGVDFSPEMAAQASRRHPELQFIEGDAHDLSGLDGPFDYVILSDLVNDVWDVQEILQQLQRLTHPRSRLILNTYSRLWEGPLAVAKRLRLAHPTLKENWLTVPDLNGLLALAGYETVRTWAEILWPLDTPLLCPLMNRCVVKLWPFRHLALTNLIVARPAPRAELRPRVSVIVPARNEAGNIGSIFARVPAMGAGTELVFVEGHSTDDTFAAIERAVAAAPDHPCQLLRQVGTGKGDAVRLGFSKATGDILMILDADLTVPPEDLPRFYEALRTRKADFVNGVRLVYPMEGQAMRVINFLGNKFFSLAFSWLLGQPVKDTLCGTKALWKSDYDTIARNRGYFGDFDPFGDFDLLFGAAKAGLKTIDLPTRYRARTYGTTNIRRWSDGWLLLRMVVFAARRVKFV